MFWFCEAADVKTPVFYPSSSLMCQALLHMAMFRHKQKTAIKYSKTLTDHFSVRPRESRDPRKGVSVNGCCCGDLSERCSENTKSSRLHPKVGPRLGFCLAYRGCVLLCACNFGFCPPPHPRVTGTPSPMPSLPSPAPCSNHGADPASSFVTVPQVIEQVAFSYVSITSLFLRAHEIWERAEELARKGSGKAPHPSFLARAGPNVAT